MFIVDDIAKKLFDEFIEWIKSIIKNRIKISIRFTSTVNGGNGKLYYGIEIINKSDKSIIVSQPTITLKLLNIEGVTIQQDDWNETKLDINEKRVFYLRSKEEFDKMVDDNKIFTISIKIDNNKIIKQNIDYFDKIKSVKLSIIN